MTFYIKLSAYLGSIYLLGFPHAALGTVGYIRVNILRAYFKVSRQNVVLFRGPLAEGLLLSERRDRLELTQKGRRKMPTHLPPAMLGGIQQLWDHQIILDFKTGAGELSSS